MSRTQIRTIIVLLIAVHVAAGLFLTPFGLAAGDNPLVQRVTIAGIGALIAQPALLALWAALGPQPLLRRWVEALIILAILDLAGLKTLSSVNLTHTRVTPEGVRWLKQTRPGLQVNAATGDRSLQAVASRFRPRSRRDLQGRVAVPLRLNAIGPKVTDLGVAYLRGMTSIERLDLTDAQVSDAALNDLITLTGLKQLVLSGARVTDSGIERLRQALPECEVVR